MTKSLIERIINRVIPLDRDYKVLLREKAAYLKARREALEESTRLERTENDRILAEEQEVRDRALKKREMLRIVGLYRLGATRSTTGVNGKKTQTDIQIRIVLKESEVKRLVEFEGKDDDGRVLTSESFIKEAAEFAMSQDVWTLWIRPWLDGTVTLEQMNKHLDRFSLPGDTKKKQEEDA